MSYTVSRTTPNGQTSTQTFQDGPSSSGSTNASPRQTAASAPAQSISSSNYSPDVVNLQKALNQKNQNTPGYTPLQVDGLYGPLTKSAEQQYGWSNIGSQSTTTLSSDKSTDIANNNAKLDQLGNKGISTDADGNATYADGSYYDDSSNSATDYSDQDKQIQDLMDTIKENTDASTKAQIDNLQQKYDQLRSDQTDVNARSEKDVTTSLLKGGVTGQGSSAQYAPISSTGIINAQENYGIKQLAALDSQENDAIATARQAQTTANNQLLEQQIDQINAIRNQKLALAADLNKTAAERVQQSQIDSAVGAQLASGVTDPSEIISNLKANGITATAADVANGIQGLTNQNTEIIKLGDGSTLLVDKTNGKVIKNFGGATDDGDSTGLPESAVRTVAVNGTQTPVDGYTLQTGDDPYLIAQQYGTDVTGIQALNPGVDLHTLPVGYVLNVPNTDESWLNGKTPDQIQAYNSLPDDDKSTVKQIVNGDALLTDIVKSRGVQGEADIKKYVNEATQIDPNFSINENKQRYTYKTQFNDPNSKSQSQIVAINTGLGHLAEFKQAADALGNHSFTDANSLKNYLTKHSGDPAVTNFNTVTTALASELATIYKGGTAPTDSEIQDWQNNIFANFSKAQSTGVANETSELISNKLSSLGTAYKTVMGSYPDEPLVSPDTIATLQSAGIDVTPITDKLKAQGYSTPAPAATTDGTSLYGSIFQGNTSNNPVDSLNSFIFQ